MIFFERGGGKILQDLFEAAVARGVAGGWAKIGDAEFEDRSGPWRGMARFRAVAQMDGLLMKLLMDDVDEPRRCYAAMHASLIGAMLRHCSARIVKIRMSPDPDFGDTPFDDD